MYMATISNFSFEETSFYVAVVLDIAKSNWQYSKKSAFTSI